MIITEIGGLRDVHMDNLMPHHGLILSASKAEIAALNLPCYTDVYLVSKRTIDEIPTVTSDTTLDEWNAIARRCVDAVMKLKSQTAKTDS